MTSSLLANFGELAAGLAYSRVSEPIRLKAKAHLLDVLGLIYLASQHANLKPARRLVAETDWADGIHSQLAFLGGVASDALWLDDFDEETRIHPGSVVVPALLAAGLEKASGESFLDGLLAGYEVLCRLGEFCRSSSLHQRGFHPSAVLGTLAAAAALARLRGMAAKEISGCMGLAASLASGLFELDSGGVIKGLQVGLAARNGVLAVSLYQAGYRPSRAILEGPQGVWRAFAGGREEDLSAAAAASLTPESRLERVSFKPYTHFTDLHPLTTLVIDLLHQEGFSPRVVEWVEIRLPSGTGGKLNLQYPPTSLKSARRCPCFLVAALICHPPPEETDPLFSHFASGSRKDPEVLELGSRVHWKDDLGEGSPQAVVRIRLEGGQTLSAAGSGYPGDGRGEETRWSLPQISRRAGRIYFRLQDDPDRWARRVASWDEVGDLRPLVDEIALWLQEGD